MKTKIYQLLTFILLGLCFFLKCTNEQKNISINDFHKGEMKFKQLIDSLGRVIVTQKYEIEESTEKLQQILKENARLREDIVYQSKLNFSLKIENEKLKKTKEDQKCSTYELANGCVSLVLEHWKDKDEMLLKSLAVETDLTLSIGKKGTVSAVFSNHCINVNSMNTLKVQPKQKWWQNGWLRFGAGVLVGGSLFFLK